MEVLYAIMMFLPEYAQPVKDCPYQSNEGGWFILSYHSDKEKAMEAMRDLSSNAKGNVSFKGHRIEGLMVESINSAWAVEANSLRLAGLETKCDIHQHTIVNFAR